MADPASLFDRVVDNEDVPVGIVSLLLFVKIALIVVVGGTFFALSAGSLSIIAVLVAFIAALTYSDTVGEGAILRTDMSTTQQAMAYWIPKLLSFLPGI